MRTVSKIYQTIKAKARHYYGHYYGKEKPDWEKRAQRFGKKAVINIGHSETYEDIKTRDQQEVFSHLRKYLSGKEELLLDYGCGIGRFSGDLAELIKCDVIGIDTTKNLIDQAFSHPKVKYQHVKPGCIPLPDKSVDIIWIFGVLGCFDGKILKKTISELKRVLRTDGVFCLTENTTECKESGIYYKFRKPEDYKQLFAFINFDHLHDYLDTGKQFQEKFSVMIGRFKNS